LSVEYYPNKIVNRKKQEEKIQNSVITPLMKNSYVSHLYIYGPSGSGKTFVTRKIFEKHYEEIKKRQPTYEYVYVCGLFANSEHSFYISVLKQLSKYFPIEINGRKYNKINQTGWSNQQFREVLYELVENNNLKLVIVFDEIDKLILREKDDMFLNSMFRVNSERLRAGKIHFIAISNSLEVEKYFGTSLNSIMGGCKLHFPGYSVQDIFDILHLFAKESLKEGTYSDEILSKIAEYSGSFSQDVRRAIGILKISAENAVDKITEEDVNKGIEEYDKETIKTELLSMNYHQQKIIYSIAYLSIQIHEQQKEKQYKIIPSPESEVTVNNVYNIYSRICNSTSVSPKSKSTVRRILEDFKQKGFINMQLKYFGRRGVSTVISLNSSEELIVEILDSDENKWGEILKKQEEIEENERI
ncbi:MAG: AAA family ATPase, partial [Candidatus Cloacimonetes bacterium]|nr:AAA family ATPase [Candidatus Cloacimonadota bacterium]